MNLRSVAVASLVMATAAFQGIRVVKAQQDRRVFDRAVNVAKVYRFGTHRQSRFDNWAYERGQTATLVWQPLPRGWFQSDVPLHLTIRVDGRDLQTYNLSINLESKTVSSADASTDLKLDEVRRWARRTSDAD